jgi:uncharacterized ferritin-like protein (DUF455 family)
MSKLKNPYKDDVWPSNDDNYKYFLAEHELADILIENEDLFRNTEKLNGMKHQYHKAHICVKPGSDNLQLKIIKTKPAFNCTINSAGIPEKITEVSPNDYYCTKSKLKITRLDKSHFHATAHFNINFVTCSNHVINIFSLKHHHQPIDLD